MFPGHGLDTNEFSHLYHALDEEVKRARIGGVARAAFRLLEGVSYLLPLVLSLAYLFDSIGPQLSPGIHTLVDQARASLGRLILPLVAATVALFLANLPLLTKAFRQWLLSRRLTALRLLDYAMLPPPRLRLKLLVLLVPLGFLMLFLYGVFMAPAEPARRRLVALLLLVLWPVALFLVDGLLRRLRGRLQYFEEVRSLRAALESTADASGESALSPKLLTRLADVERARLLRGSAEAIGHRPLGAETTYAVSKSDSAAATLRKLGAGERLRIERALEDLAARQEGSVEAKKEGPPCTLHAEGTPWQLVYEVEPATRTIHILAIRAQKDYA